MLVVAQVVMVIDQVTGAIANVRQLLQDISEPNQAMQIAIYHLNPVQIDVQMLGLVMPIITT